MPGWFEGGQHIMGYSWSPHGHSIQQWWRLQQSTRFSTPALTHDTAGWTTAIRRTLRCGYFLFYQRVFGCLRYLRRGSDARRTGVWQALSVSNSGSLVTSTGPNPPPLRHDPRILDSDSSSTWHRSILVPMGLFLVALQGIRLDELSFM